uniref:Uncharacterized protein TCIL3000_4_2980 n=1 Tax=Trypanosoma congolense (strain IL3000) TaxID=1068625 RepID=G0ULF0_TRYCI|nr:unnamed protein product [Trypanosoma congolense IL3000]
MHLVSRGAGVGVGPPFQTPDTASHRDWYPSLCAREFYGASIWEVALLALTPYFSTDHGIRKMLHFMNKHMNTDWVMRERHGASCVSTNSSTTPTKWNGYFDFYSERHDLSLISIRGTDMTSISDYLIDFNMFFEVIIYHLLSNVVPGASILPSNLIADLIGAASLPSDTSAHHENWEALAAQSSAGKPQCVDNNYRRDFFADVYNHIRYVGVQKDRPKHILVTGHSLGGVVASIIGAKTGIQAISFGAPGITLMRKKYNVDLQQINRNVVNIISSHDIFPMIGGNGGEEHHIECLATTRELCHAMEFLIGALWRSCASIRSRFPLIESVQ